MNMDESKPVQEAGQEPAGASADPDRPGTAPKTNEAATGLESYSGAHVPSAERLDVDKPESAPGIAPEPIGDSETTNVGCPESAQGMATAELKPTYDADVPQAEGMTADETEPAAEIEPISAQEPADPSLGETGPAVSAAATDLEPPPCEKAPPKELHILRTLAACVAGALVPGLGHAVLRKWDRAIVFFGTIGGMFALGIHLNGRLFGPDFSDVFSVLRFIADAGIGPIYWVSWLRGLGAGDPGAYTYDFANIFIYVAGLLNMLVIVDTFDIAQERKP
jgi:hypothetical protein